MDNTVFKNSRYEEFEYELLSLQNGVYSHKADITNYVKSGQIKIDFTRNIIGSASFEIIENDNIDINYLSDFIQVWYNITGSGLSYRIPLGVYSLITPDRSSDGILINRKISAYDLLYILEQDKTTTASSYPSGTNVIDAIESLLDSVGSWVKYKIEPNDETLSEDMTYQLGRSKLYIINGLLNAINYYPLWCTGNGVFKSIPWTNIQNVTWNFYDDNESLYQKGVNASFDYSDIYNKVIVVTNETTADTAPLTSTLTFEDLGLAEHPFSYTNIGYYKTKVFNSEAVSQAYVDDRAERELLKMLEINESINYKHAFVTSRESDGIPYQGDCYKFRNSLLNLDNTYKIQSMDYKLKVGSMITSTIRRVAYV